MASPTPSSLLSDLDPPSTPGPHPVPKNGLRILPHALLHPPASTNPAHLRRESKALLVSDFGPKISFRIVDTLRDAKLKSGTEIKVIDSVSVSYSGARPSCRSIQSQLVTCMTLCCSTSSAAAASSASTTRASSSSRSTSSAPESPSTSRAMSQRLEQIRRAFQGLEGSHVWPFQCLIFHSQESSTHEGQYPTSSSSTFITQGRDCLVVMATGSGKSMWYKACWLPLLAKHTEAAVADEPLVVPLDCEWIWHCHRLNPVMRRYAAGEMPLANWKDCNQIQSTAWQWSLNI